MDSVHNLYFHEKENELLVAIETGDLDRVKQLLSSGIWINTVLHSKSRQESATILATAAFEGCADIVRYLIRCHAQINYQDPCLSRNALHWACMGGHIGAVQVLLEHKADVNCQDRDNVTPIIRAAIAGKRDIVQLLVGYGANVTLYDRLHSSPIHYATFRGYADVIEALIKAGCIPNDPTIFGQGTPLANLFYHGDFNNCTLLLEAGYDLSRDSWILQHRSASHTNSCTALDCLLVHEYTTPSGLERLCRKAIRNHLGGIYLQKKIRQLPLPQKIIEYLLLENI